MCVCYLHVEIYAIKSSPTLNKYIACEKMVNRDFILRSSEGSYFLRILKAENILLKN